MLVVADCSIVIGIQINFQLGKFTGLHYAILVGGDRIEEQFQAVHEKPDM